MAAKTSAKTSTKSKSTSVKWTKEKIRDAYIRTILIEGKQPNSVFKFTDNLGLPESEFYTFYSSFDAIENEVFQEMMTATLKSVQGDTQYAEFSAREKLLTFYYAHIEVLVKQRSLVAMKWPELKRRPTTPDWLKGYKEAFLSYARTIVGDAIEGEEIKERRYISDKYDKAFWLQLMFVIDYWIKDTSADFENTDAAIEKAVNLSFQLLSDSTLDSIVDFAKFLWQSK